METQPYIITATAPDLPLQATAGETRLGSKRQNITAMPG